MFWTFLIIGIILMFIGNLTVYVVRSRSIMSDIKDTLRESASNIASLVPTQIHESLIDPSQQSSSDYKFIETDFRLVMAGNPNISDIYTLRPTSKPHTMIFVVDAQITEDSNHNNVIDDEEIKAALGESFNTESLPRLEEAVNKPTVDDEINYDKWGAWLSGYAPIKDDSGKTVAILGVDYSADYISTLRNEAWHTIIYIDLILIPLIILSAWFVSRRVSRPFSILAYGLERLSHGDFEYRLPISKHKDERIFEELFDRIVSLFNTLKNRKPSED